MILAVAALVAASRIVTLDEAVQSARERQPQLRQARASTAAADARARQAFAPLLPQLSATAGYQRTTANTIEQPGSGTTVVGRPGGSSFDTFNSLSDNSCRTSARAPGSSMRVSVQMALRQARADWLPFNSFPRGGSAAAPCLASCATARSRTAKRPSSSSAANSAGVRESQASFSPRGSSVAAASAFRTR